MSGATKAIGQMIMLRRLLVIQVVVTASCGILGSCIAKKHYLAKCVLPKEFAIICDDATNCVAPPRKILHRASGAEMVLAKVAQDGDALIGTYVALRLHSSDVKGNNPSEDVTATWPDAVEICQAMGLRLPTIEELIAASRSSDFCHESKVHDGEDSYEWNCKYGGTIKFANLRMLLPDQEFYPFTLWMHCGGKIAAAAGCDVFPDAGVVRRFRVAICMRFENGSSSVVPPINQ